MKSRTTGRATSAPAAPCAPRAACPDVGFGDAGLAAHLLDETVSLSVSAEAIAPSAPVVSALGLGCRWPGPGNQGQAKLQSHDFAQCFPRQQRCWPGDGRRRLCDWRGRGLISRASRSHLAMALAWALHARRHWLEPTGRCAHFGFAAALSMTAWLVLTIYALERELFPQMRTRWALGALGGVAVLLAALFPGGHCRPRHHPGCRCTWAWALPAMGCLPPPWPMPG